MSDGVWIHIVTVVTLLSFKLAVLIVGYLIARLGYDLLLKGISGQFTFSTQFKGGKADLVSASPGVFFILMATVMIAIAIIKDKPFETEITERTVASSAEQTDTDASEKAKPVLRKNSQ